MERDKTKIVKEKITALQSWLEKYPEDADAYMALARIYQRQEKYASASIEICNAIKYHTEDNIFSQYDLYKFRATELGGGYGGGKNDYEALCRLIIDEIMNISRQLRKHEEFYSFMQLLLKLDKTNTHVLFELARELIKKRDYQAALELTNQHEAYCKDIAGFYFCRMIIFSEIGEQRSAIESAVTYVAKSCKKPVWSMSMLINLDRIKSLFIMNASLVLTMAGEDNMGTDHNQAECNLQVRFYDILRKLLMHRYKHDILEPFWHLYFDPNRRDYPIITDNDEWETII